MSTSTNKSLTHLSQSFFIDEPTFVTKVDLFFQSKDSTIPFKFNIRRNKEGRPTNDVLNFSQVVVDSANVNISSNANVATSVNFAAPVFLDKGEYSLNLGADSRAYNVYVATLNEQDLTLGSTITQQPALGTFFQSENLSSFTPSLFDDLKFTLYRAKFNTGVTARVDIRQKFNEISSDVYDETLETDPLELFKDRSTMKVYHFNHGYANDSFVHIDNIANTYSNVRTISGATDFLGGGDEGGNIFGLDGNVFTQGLQISNVKLNSYTVDLGAGKIPVLTEPRTRFGGPSVSIGKNIAYTTILPRISTFNAGNATINHKIKQTTLGTTYTKDTDFITIKNLVDNKFDEEKVIASLINKDKKQNNVLSLDYVIEMSTNNDRVSPLIDNQQIGIQLRRDLIDNTTYSATVFEHELTTLSNTLTPHRANITRTSNGIGIINLANVMDMNNANAVINGTILNVQANTTQTNGSGANNSGLYRVIDIFAGSASNVSIKVAKLSGDIENDVNNSNVYSIVTSNDFVTEEAATGGTTYSKYITREVTFNNPSTGLRFLVDAAVPLNSNLDFYIKTKLAGDNTNLRDIEYKKVTGVVIPNSLEGEFVEVNHQIDDIDAFNSVIFKIVFNAASTTNAPKIKNFRLIAVN